MAATLKQFRALRANAPFTFERETVGEHFALQTVLSTKDHCIDVACSVGRNIRQSRSAGFNEGRTLRDCFCPYYLAGGMEKW